MSLLSTGCIAAVPICHLKKRFRLANHLNILTPPKLILCLPARNSRDETLMSVKLDLNDNHNRLNVIEKYSMYL